jgi:hypothetical protein
VNNRNVVIWTLWAIHTWQTPTNPEISLDNRYINFCLENAGTKSIFACTLMSCDEYHRLSPFKPEYHAISMR